MLPHEPTASELKEYIAACNRMVPTVLPVRTAARLTGKSELAFRRDLVPHVKTADGRVNLPLMEMRIGRVFGLLEYLAAVKSLDRIRRRDRAAKQRSPAK